MPTEVGPGRKDTITPKGKPDFVIDRKWNSGYEWLPYVEGTFRLVRRRQRSCLKTP